MIRRRISVLGSTGSVGCSTLDLMDQAEIAGSGAFEVEVLTGVPISRDWRSRHGAGDPNWRSPLTPRGWMNCVTR